MQKSLCKRYLLPLLIGGFVATGLVALIVIVRTLACKIPPSEEVCTVTETDHYIPLSKEAIARLSKDISIKTISDDNKGLNYSELVQLQQFLINSFPLIHNSPFIKLEIINNYSLLYYINGQNPSLQPYFLAAHLDVVPADPEKWDVPPFEGRVQDGFIYGRGALDDKSQHLGILEALEEMLKTEFKPQRSFYIGFGHDEEVQGINGAREIGNVLKQRGVKLIYLMDEGTMILTDVINMVPNPVAVISVSEKGYATFKMTVKGVYGHSSFPPPSTSIGILANAITKLENNLHPNKFGLGAEKSMLELLAPYAGPVFRMIFSNIWLFGSAIARVMANDPIQNSLIRTTTAVTMINGGIKSNVVPAVSWAVVNHRIHPTESVAKVLEYDKMTVNDERVEFEILDQVEPAPISPYSSSTFGFQTIKKSIKQVFSDAVVVPGLMVAATDTKWYHHLTDQMYRFSPFLVSRNDTKRYHGDNERISIQNYEQVINFYHHLILNSDVAELKLETQRTEL